MTCRKCATELESDSVFCIECGAQVPPQSSDTGPDEQVGARALECRSCNQLFEDDSRFCATCGGELGPQILEVIAHHAPMCQRCDSELTPSAAFCRMCGFPVETKAEPEFSQDTATTADVIGASLFDFQGIGKGTRFGAIAVVVALVLTFVVSRLPGFTGPLTVEQMPLYTAAFSENELAAHAALLCGVLAESLPSAEELQTYESRRKAIEAHKSFDGRAMLAYSKTVSWLNDADLVPRFVTEVDNKFSSGLEALMKSVDIRGIDDSNRASLQKRWKVDYSTDVSQRCAFTEKRRDAVNSLTKYDDAVSAARSVIQNVPWFPKGFKEFSDEVAYKWSKRKDRCFSRCSYWAVDVITKRGCDNLYVQLSILDSGGNNIGWTNDTATSVKAGQIAKLMLTTYESGVASGSIDEIRCY